MKKINALAFLLAAALATSVQAETSATGIGTSIAGADATLNMGNILSLGSAAAACANNIGPISWSDNTCERVMLANYWAARGNFSLADEIILADPKVKAAVHSLSDKKEASAPPVSKTAVSTKSSPAGAITVKVLASSADEMKLRVNGKVYVLSGKALSQFKSGAKLTFGAAKLRMSDLPA